MRSDKQFFKSIALAALLGTGFSTAGVAQDTTNIVNPETEAPAILKTTPAGGAMNVDLSSVIEITFNREMDKTTINGNTMILHTSSADSMHKQHGEMMDDPKKEKKSVTNDSENNQKNIEEAVNGTISYSDKMAVFTPDSDLKEGTMYTFTVTNSVKTPENIALENIHNWSFKTMGSSDSTYTDLQDENPNMNRNEQDRNIINSNRMVRNEFSEKATETTDSAYTLRQNMNYSNDSATDTMNTTFNGENNMIDLGKAGQFVILAKKTINNESESRITGRTGEGSATDVTKSEKTKEEMAFADSVRKSTSDEVMIWQSNQSDTASTDVSEAIKDMMSAHSDALLQSGNDATSQMNESLHTAELTSGIREWSDSLNIESDVTLSGSADDVWVFKIGNNLNVNENTVFTLTDGARADNIFWIVEGEVTIGKDANFEGIILSMNDITLEKGAKLNGRMFSQTSITLDDNTITEPGSMAGQRTSTNR